MAELPEVPEGYSWQLCQGDADMTGHLLDYRDADEIRLWHEAGDLAIALKARGNGWWEVAEGLHCGRFVESPDEAMELACLPASPEEF